MSLKEKKVLLRLNGRYELHILYMYMQSILKMTKNDFLDVHSSPESYLLDFKYLLDQVVDNKEEEDNFETKDHVIGDAHIAE